MKLFCASENKKNAFDFYKCMCLRHFHHTLIGVQPHLKSSQIHRFIVLRKGQRLTNLLLDYSRTAKLTQINTFVNSYSILLTLYISYYVEEYSEDE